MKKMLRIMVTMFLLLTLTVQGFAGNFTPSATQKGAPEIVPYRIDGVDYDAIIIKRSTGEIVTGISKSNLIITPISNADTAMQSIRDNLQSAHASIITGKTISSVVPGFDEAVKNIDSSLTPDNFVVRDLFSVSVDGQVEEFLTDENQISVRFKTDLSAEQPIVIMQYVDGVWSVIDQDNIIRHGDGSVTVQLDSLGVLAIAVDANTIDANGPKSPYTGDVRPILYAAVGFAVIVSAGIITVIKKRKNRTSGGLAS